MQGVLFAKVANIPLSLEASESESSEYLRLWEFLCLSLPMISNYQNTAHGSSANCMAAASDQPNAAVLERILA